jgi:hypothetical protein
MNAPIPEDKVEQIKAAIFAGKKIEAIKLFREYTGKGLAESKGLVESLAAELKAKEPDKFVPPPSAQGCFGLVLFIGLVVTAVLLRILRHSDS